MASSVREYLTCPAGGVLSVKFDVSADVGIDGKRLESEERSGGLGTDLGETSGKGQLCSGLFTRPQGFLEVHKL